VLIPRHQVTARLPGADRVNHAPGPIDDDNPYQEIQRCRPVGSRADSAMPAGKVWLEIGCGQVLHRSLHSPEVRDQHRDEYHGGPEEQQEHHRVGDNDPARPGVHGENGVAQPRQHQRLPVVQRCEIGKQNRRALGDYQQVASQAENDGGPRHLLYSPAVKAFPQEIRHGRGPAAAQEGSKQQRSIDITGHGNAGQQDVGAHLSVVGEARFPEEGGGAEYAGHQGAYNQEGRRAPASDKVVVQCLYFAPAVTADKNENGDTDSDGGGIQIDRSFPCFLAGLHSIM